MYRYEKKESKFKRIIGTIALMIATSAISILLYNMYLKIDILKAPTKTGIIIGFEHIMS